MKKMLVAVTAFAALAAGLASTASAKESANEYLDDSTITATVKAHLLDNKDTHSASINVETYRGVVQLSGFVASEAEKAKAAKVAADVKGVKDVVNSVSIAPKTSIGTKLDDSVITGKVKAALMDSADVKSMQINVETHGGVTQLAGFVTSEKMKEKAGKVAGDVSGVKSVENVLVVKTR
jgi:hyperosmotically inducible protein